VIRDAGRIPIERSTRYGVLRRFPEDPALDPAHPLDAIDDAEAVFGSYAELTRKARLQRTAAATNAGNAGNPD
jgi:hypothetical protein